MTRAAFSFVFASLVLSAAPSQAITFTPVGEVGVDFGPSVLPTPADGGFILDALKDDGPVFGLVTLPSPPPETPADDDVPAAPAPVPLPPSALMLAAALGVSAFYRRRRLVR